MSPILSKFSSFALVALLSTHTAAHSWNEQLVVISDNGSFTGAYGYPRGYMARTDPGFDGESDKYQLPSLASGRTYVNSTDLLCHPSQRSQNQTSKYPRLQASPGSWVAFRQLENGHTSLPQNQPGKPDNRGTVYVYATTQPKTDETLVDVISWTQDGSGGDKRGRLIAMNDFDDLRCHQMNDGAISTQRQAQWSNPVPGQPGTKSELWCETDVQIPKDTSFAQPGKPLTVYWIWDWPYLPGSSPGLPQGKQEWYTTCSDIDIVANTPSGPLANKLDQQDPMASAVDGYMSRSAKYTVPSYFTWTVSGNTPPAAPTNGAAVVASSTTALSSTTAVSSTGSAALSSSILTPSTATSSHSPATLSASGTGSVVTALITVVATLAPGESVTTVSGTHVVAFTAQASDAVSSSSSSGLVMTTVTIPAAPTYSATAASLGLSPIQILSSAGQTPVSSAAAAATTTAAMTPTYRRRSAKFGRL